MKAIALVTARCWLAMVVGGAGFIAAGLTAAEPNRTRTDPSDAFFAQGEIPRLQIEIKGAEWEALQRDNREYVRATVREGDRVYEEVGIHLKGAAGSFRGLDDKPALTLNFDKFRKGQDFHGLDKLHLNNSVQDPSYMTEALCGWLFEKAGVPATRVTHARVSLNGRDRGFYVLKEGFDKTFLKRHFDKASGNLYDGGFLREITEALEKTSGKGVDDRSDLKALAQAAQVQDRAERWKRLDQVLDLNRFISFIAMEVITWHWDGYAMKRNNYRIYQDPTSNRFVFLPHGMDQMFWDANGPAQPYFDGLVARAVCDVPEGKTAYYNRMKQMLQEFFTPELIDERIDELHRRIRPVLAEIDPSQARQHDHEVEALRDRIGARVEALSRQLNLPSPGQPAFDEGGTASLRGLAWRPRSDGSDAVADRVKIDGRTSALHIASAKGPCRASWRATMELPRGHYQLASRIRAKGVAGEGDQYGGGVGLRVSGASRSAGDGLSGDIGDWREARFDFEVKEDRRQVELICELRAASGEAWFELSTLALRRLKDQ